MTDKTGDLMNKLTSTDTPEELDRYLEEIRGKYPDDFSSFVKAVLQAFAPPAEGLVYGLG